MKKLTKSKYKSKSFVWCHIAGWWRRWDKHDCYSLSSWASLLIEATQTLSSSVSSLLCSNRLGLLVSQAFFSESRGKCTWCISHFEEKLGDRLESRGELGPEELTSCLCFRLHLQNKKAVYKPVLHKAPDTCGLYNEVFLEGVCISLL